MKVLIVTTQRHFNFGTLLQCHALQHYLESQGCDVDVLDYLGKEYSRSGISRFRILLGDLRRHPFKYLQILLNSRKRQKRKKLFKKFLKERVNLTQSKYATLIDIKGIFMNMMSTSPEAIRYGIRDWEDLNRHIFLNLPQSNGKKYRMRQASASILSMRKKRKIYNQW